MSLVPISLRAHHSREGASDTEVVAALDSLRIAVVILDQAERISYANAHFAYLFRSLPGVAETIGWPYEKLIRWLIVNGEIADDTLDEGTDAFVTRLKTHLASPGHTPHDIRLADGTVIEIKARSSEGGGRILLWSDVTESRDAMIRLESAIALSADAFAFYDRDDALVLCNDEYASLFSLDKSELIGHRFADLLTPEYVHNFIADENETEAWIAGRLASHRQATGVATLTTADGTVYLIRDRATADGGRVVVFTDATEQQRAEKALAEQTHALDRTKNALAATKAETLRQAAFLTDLTSQLDRTVQETDVAKKSFLRTMSHELKTPLNAIIGFSDLLIAETERLSTAEIGEYADLIRQGGSHLLRLINQILDLARISSGRFELHKMSLDAGAALWQAMDMLAEKAKAKRIAVVLEEPGPGPMVFADDAALSAMTRNLVENAVSFTQEGGEVRLSAKQDDGQIVIVVSDNGPGVAAEDLPRILQPFEQVGRSHAEHTGGAGLGLTLVKALSELHGGEFTVASTPGKGFIATIALPAAP